MDIPRIFNITESAHRIHNPITPEKLATLGAALRLESGARVLDLGSGSVKGVSVELISVLKNRMRSWPIELLYPDRRAA